MKCLTHSEASQKEEVKGRNCRAGFKGSLLLLAAVVTLSSGIAAKAKYSGGTGEPNNPYRIVTAEDLNDIGNHFEDFNKCFVMINDINLSAYTGMQFNTIGLYVGYNDPCNEPFTGVFDGNGHTISNFIYDTGGEVDGIGLFRYVEREGISIQNLTLTDVNVFGGARVGALCGRLHAGVDRCEVDRGTVKGDSAVGVLVGLNSGDIGASHATGAVTGADDLGGLVGYNSYGNVSNCYAVGLVAGEFNVGGLCGVNRGEVADCWADADVSGQSFSGGLVGNNISPFALIVGSHAFGFVSGDYGTGGLAGLNDAGTVRDSYAGAEVSGGDQAGGLVGGNTSEIARCYSMGKVSGSSYVGGLVGYSVEGGTVSGSFWDVNTSGEPNSAGGTGKMTAEMQMRSTFEDAGWDFNDVWAICEGTNYPRHIWSIPVADFLCPDGVNFIDYSFFADWWLTDNCADANDCEGADIDLSGIVDEADLRSFSTYWLSGLN